MEGHEWVLVQSPEPVRRGEQPEESLHGCPLIVDADDRLEASNRGSGCVKEQTRAIVVDPRNCELQLPARMPLGGPADLAKEWLLWSGDQAHRGDLPRSERAPQGPKSDYARCAARDPLWVRRTADRREVDVRPALRDELLDHKAKTPFSGPGDYVFPTESGARPSASNVRNRILARAIKRANENRVEHDLAALPEGQRRTRCDGPSFRCCWRSVRTCPT